MEVVDRDSQFPIVTRDRRPDALGDFNLLSDEIVCSILNLLSPRDVARLACASSVMYILCNEEPLWMNLCLSKENRQFQYKGSWKRTTLDGLQVMSKCEDPCKKPLQFDGFNSLFLYKRLYRCYTQLDGFAFDQGNVERKTDLSQEEFFHQYDGLKPVLVSGLADTWAARKTWTPEQLLEKYGDTSFRISQRSANKISMKLKDYVSYIQEQHDEDPLYIFDDKFGEVAPDLLKDYSVPHLFPDDYFDVLDSDLRPPYRWLIIGPERSGASWHVDPALTSAWNTLLCGRKRWALYPPGRVPLGVTVHVNDEDGDVDIETPSSLQWWLDFYPLLADEDKPIECTQLPGETIYVPTGWWHCVLNLETTIAVTQNYVNSKNFEYVCLDMAPGYQHKGVCRAGLLALSESILEENGKLSIDDNLSSSELVRKEKRVKVDDEMEDLSGEGVTNGSDLEFSYDINFLTMFLDKNIDHYNSLWSTSNCIGQRELRDWLWKLWIGKPGLRDLIWKGACIALNTNKWSKCMVELCSSHNISLPANEEKFPVGTGSNPVYLVGDNVVKIFVEDGLQASLHALGTELEFYNLMQKSESTLKNHVPTILASGIVCLENGVYNITPWNGKGVPDVIANHSIVREAFPDTEYPFGIWSKKQFEYKKAGMPLDELVSSGGHSNTWPYIITKRCKGKIFAELRDELSWDEVSDLASFLGKQLHDLHVLPVTPLNNLSYLQIEKKLEIDNSLKENLTENVDIPEASKVFFTILNRKKKDVTNRLTKWGYPIPSTLIEKVHEYLPNNFMELHSLFKNENGSFEVRNCCSWIHTDIMDDNIHLEQSYIESSNACTVNSDINGSSNGKKITWRPSYIYDFSNMSLGDPILDVIPIHLDIFRGDLQLLKKLFESYGHPFGKRTSLVNGSIVRRISYLAMCYCIIHEENILGAIFGTRKELRTVNSWEGVEEAVWGDLNNYF
ncbi:lysine-specific demethylase JMJ21 [Rutidosis leptorrhynchoides]|uniref:lysine-specific demethylase JMJ21 n=1 Tax=Rutidosis leptorrhynchoides TaxID=125765 RepID=UPI003A993DC4